MNAIRVHHAKPMPTFTRFSVTRRCFSSCVGWKTYNTIVDYAEPTTLETAERNSRNMDWKESTTLAVKPVS